MTINLVIADCLLKTQIFNKIRPNKSDPNLKRLINALFSKRWEEVMIKGIPFKKLYLGGTKYRAVVHARSEDCYLLVFYRFKNNDKSKNISKYDNESSQEIYKNFLKVIDSINQESVINYVYHKNN